ncbi:MULTISPECIES: calcium/sodium antiporter [unclassified Roseitalea]|uniref:calcium/sodium antiporter n=1 Tax=unclassified Roseitalea TaxID=2639107 RepID=UPI00273FF535|nr:MULTISPECIES: calcium/sodium antiporter [unclassified Roseitalea]
MRDLVLVLAGLFGLFVGGELLVRGAVAVALRLGLTAFVVGVVVVGFGTSMPELLVSVRAAIGGTPGIALGNVIGSNIANILLIAGIGLTIAPMAAMARSARIDVVAMLAVGLAASALLFLDTIGRLAGLGLLALLVAYLVHTLRAGGQDRASPEGTIMQRANERPLVIVGLLLAGLVLLFAGAEMLIRGATAIARRLGISEAVIGLTVVAVGTSLPELATTLVAAIRRQGAVAIGNVVGSNIFNVLGILGIAALVAPIPAAGVLTPGDAAVLAAATIVFALLLLAGRTIGRPWGIAFLCGYGGYTAWLFIG